MSPASVKPLAQGKKRPGPEEQRKIILDAAVEQFSTRGCNSPSVSDICKQAGVSRDTFYRCFSDKDALIGELYQTAVNDHVELVLGSWDLDYSNQQWLHTVCDNTIDAILDQHKVAQFLFVESADPNSNAYRIIHQAYDKAVVRMRSWSRKRYGRAPTREFLVSLLVATQWLVHNAILKGATKREVDKAKAAAEQLFYGAFSMMEKTRST